MMERQPIRVAIVDYGLGNLFSVKHACEHVGMQGIITSANSEILAADAVILPGVGAFGAAMESLKKLDLISVLRDVALSDKPFFGICLGMQLLMTESYEFGFHKGLGIIKGSVVRLDKPTGPSGKLKVPQVGWNRIIKGLSAWSASPLAGLADGAYMYFVHSFYVKPEDPQLLMATTRYGDIEFCSALKQGHTFAMQFHPERSGAHGLRIYRNIASIIRGQEIVEEKSRAWKT